MLATKGMRFPIDVILVCIRWCAAYPLSYRHLEEVMQERGVCVDHSSINRWAIRFLPLLEKVFRRHKRPVGATVGAGSSDLHSARGARINALDRSHLDYRPA